MCISNFSIWIVALKYNLISSLYSFFQHFKNYFCLIVLFGSGSRAEVLGLIWRKQTNIIKINKCNKLYMLHYCLLTVFYKSVSIPNLSFHKTMLFASNMPHPQFLIISPFVLSLLQGLQLWRERYLTVRMSGYSCSCEGR